MNGAPVPPDRVRCFVAVDFPEEVRNDLRRLQQRLRARDLDLRWVQAESMHLTLKFLGEPDRKTFDAVAEALSAPLEGFGALRLEPRGLGAFPTPRRARVLWVGLAGDVAALARLALTVESRMETVGIPREGRAFAPHLTLGRARGPAGIDGVDAALRAEEGYAGPPFTVTEIVLYESRLRPQGPQYIPRKTIPLS